MIILTALRLNAAGRYLNHIHIKMTQNTHGEHAFENLANDTNMDDMNRFGASTVPTQRTNQIADIDNPQ